MKLPTLPTVVESPERFCASYAGHFRHANSWRLRRRFLARYPWLRKALQQL